MKDGVSVQFSLLSGKLGVFMFCRQMHFVAAEGVEKFSLDTLLPDTSTLLVQANGRTASEQNQTFC